MDEELNDQERRELARWRSGSLRKSWPVVDAVPDGLQYAAELARAQGTEGGDEHDELLRQAATRLRDMNDAARVLIAERELDEGRVAYLEARVGELHNTIGELRAESANRLEVGDRLGWRLVEAEQEISRLRREVEFEANGADTFSGADAVAERGEVGAPFLAEDFGLDVDTDAGGIYISLNHRRAARTEDWGPDVSVDYDVDGIPTGVEILRAPGSLSVSPEEKPGGGS